MGVRILHDQRADMAALYCSTSDFSFGPVFYASKTRDAAERAEAFLRWLGVDPRVMVDSDIERRYGEWLTQEEAQYASEGIL